MPGLIEVEIPQLRDLRGKFASMSNTELKEMTREAMREQGAAIIEKLAQEAPVSSGDLRKSFYTRTFDSASKLSLRVYSRMPYALTVALGTKKHDYPILPKVGKVLAMKKFEIIGPFAARQSKMVFRKVVFRHPGQKGNPYHVRAMKRLRPEWDAIWNRMGVRVVQRLAGK